MTEAATQTPLAGADVRVSGPALIGGARATQTDDDGRYELVELPPGIYDVEVSYPGVKPIRRRVVVRQGETAPLDIAWSRRASAEAEDTVIVEERHLTKPDSTQTGTVISADPGQGRHRRAATRTSRSRSPASSTSTAAATRRSRAAT